MDNLPRSVRDIIDLVGVIPALALVRAYPGLTLKVPTGAREDGQVRARLIGIMGFEAAEKFIATYGGERLTRERQQYHPVNSGGQRASDHEAECVPKAGCFLQCI